MGGRCHDVLKEYARGWIVAVCIVTSVSFVYQAIILVLLRYLQTSIALAVKKGDPTADSLGYLLPACLSNDDMTDYDMVPLIVTRGSPSFASAPPPTASAREESAKMAWEKAASFLKQATSALKEAALEQAASALKQATAAWEQAALAERDVLLEQVALALKQAALKQAVSALEQAASARGQATSALKQATSTREQALLEQMASARGQATSAMEQATSARGKATLALKEAALKQAVSALDEAAAMLSVFRHEPVVINVDVDVLESTASAEAGGPDGVPALTCDRVLTPTNNGAWLDQLTSDVPSTSSSVVSMYRQYALYMYACRLYVTFPTLFAARFH